GARPRAVGRALGSWPYHYGIRVHQHAPRSAYMKHGLGIHQEGMSPKSLRAGLSGWSRLGKSKPQTGHALSRTWLVAASVVRSGPFHGTRRRSVTRHNWGG